MIAMVMVQFIISIGIIMFLKRYFGDNQVGQILNERWDSAQEQREIKEKIQAYMTNNKQINFDKIIPENLGNAHVVKSNTKIEDVNKIIGMKWKKAEDLFIEEFDFYNVVIFTKGNKVQQYVRIPRNFGDFKKVSDNTFEIIKNEEEKEAS